jgi:predicted O-linked N-acetylglucosamine transferase (SPINDLY family)
MDAITCCEKGNRMPGIPGCQWQGGAKMRSMIRAGIIVSDDLNPQKRGYYSCWLHEYQRKQHFNIFSNIET